MSFNNAGTPSQASNPPTGTIDVLRGSDRFNKTWTRRRNGTRISRVTRVRLAMHKMVGPGGGRTKAHYASDAFCFSICQAQRLLRSRRVCDERHVGRIITMRASLEPVGEFQKLKGYQPRQPTISGTAAMGIQYWIAGLVSLIGLASFIFFAFCQGMRVRPRGREYGAGVGEMSVAPHQPDARVAGAMAAATPATKQRKNEDRPISN